MAETEVYDLGATWAFGLNYTYEVGEELDIREPTSYTYGEWRLRFWSRGVKTTAKREELGNGAVASILKDASFSILQASGERKPRRVD